MKSSTFLLLFFAPANESLFGDSDLKYVLRGLRPWIGAPRAPTTKELEGGNAFK